MERSVLSVFQVDEFVLWLLLESNEDLSTSS